MKNVSSRNFGGFTLIELLVVVLIIGILSAVALPKYQKAVDRAKGVEALVLGKAVVEAENIYYLENGNYYPDIGKDKSLLSIELPKLEDWYIGTGGGSCSCGPNNGCGTFECFFLIGVDPYKDTLNRDFYKTQLGYYLENGKEVCRCCSGEKCQNYFGVKDGEEF